jgi:dTDP-4-amino-4,6-dideoxygalactose transaminase
MEGSNSALFEKEFAQRLGSPHATVMSSGTAALTSAMAALDIKPGDEVLVPAYTFISTPFAPMVLGAIPVLVEVDQTLTMDAADLRAKITDRTKAIIPVHINGLPCAMDSILGIAKEYGLSVVEDACQAVGGGFGGKSLGTMGDFGAFSFNYYKTLSCGEGGALISGDSELYEKGRIYHDAGCAFFSPDQLVKTPYFAGANYRMSELLSAVMRVQLTRLDGILRDLRERKSFLLAQVPRRFGWTASPVHDAHGDCGVKTGFLLKDHIQAKALAESINALKFCLKAECPLDTSRHVYSNWEAVLEGRSPLGSAIPGRRYAKDCCPRTLTNLGRTLYLTVHPDTPLDEIDRALAVLSDTLK